jgi:hemoglobin-like flavoprotein
MKNCIWFIGSKSSVDYSVVRKVIRIAKAFNYSISILCDNTLYQTKPPYWSMNKTPPVLAGHLDMQKHRQQQIQSQLADHSIPYYFVEVTNANNINSVLKLVHNHHSTLMIFESSQGISRHSVLQRLTKLPLKLLLISQSQWSMDMRFLAAVDTARDDCRAQAKNIEIINVTREWSNNLNGSWQVMHTCDISPHSPNSYLKINRLQETQFAKFCHTNSVHINKRMFLEGKAAHVLQACAKEEKVDILTLGLPTKNRLASFWTRSITTTLIDNPPCDMLLLTTSSVTRA